jgi:hypothetical protein
VVVTRESGLVRSPSNPLSWVLTLTAVRLGVAQGYFAACGQRRGLLALDLGNIFWKKLLHQKNFTAPQCAVNKRKSDTATVTKIDFICHNYKYK